MTEKKNFMEQSELSAMDGQSGIGNWRNRARNNNDKAQRTLQPHDL